MILIFKSSSTERFLKQQENNVCCKLIHVLTKAFVRYTKVKTYQTTRVGW